MGSSAPVALFSGVIASVPALLWFPSAIAEGIVSIGVAICIVIIAASSPSGDRSRLPHLVSPVSVIGLAGTFVVMALQIAPMPGGPLMNPIWSSAAAAMGEKPSGSITIDTGTTFLMICRLTCMVAIALLTALIGQHRRRAETLLSVLAGIATLVSLEQIADSFLPRETLRIVAPTAQSAAVTISIFGFVLTVAAIIRGYERSRPSRSQSRPPGPSAGIELAAAVAASLINLTAVVYSGDHTLLFAALFGAGLLLAILVIRKGRLGYWGQAGTAAMLCFALANFVAFMPGRIDNDLVARMLDDARPLGVGAGTLAALAPIYGGSAPVETQEVAAAATVAIEMGRPFLCLVVLIAATSALFLLKDSLQRRRDYVYPAAGAGCIAASLISALSTGGSLSLASCIVLSAGLGLAIAQSRGEATSLLAATGPRPPASVSAPRYAVSRGYGALLASALILTGQGAWILLPELSRPMPIGFPSEQRQATIARQDQERANRSAELAAVRGDLWAAAAFADASMLWTDQALELDASDDRTARVSKNLLKTLHYAPHRGDAWLMLAATCERLRLTTCQVGTLLKMSYYTAPGQVGLLPVRLEQSLRSNHISDDDELADLVRRDIRSVLAGSADRRSILIQAYRSASPAGKRLVEQTVTPVDPGYLKLLRTPLT